MNLLPHLNSFIFLPCISLALINYCNWRVSKAREILSGVTQLKIRDIFLFIGERDSIRGG